YHLCLFFYYYASPSDIYTLSLHDALPICASRIPEWMWRKPDPAYPQYSPWRCCALPKAPCPPCMSWRTAPWKPPKRGWAGPLPRSEEHTSELQSRFDLVCRLLLEKKKTPE